MPNLKKKLLIFNGSTKWFKNGLQVLRPKLRRLRNKLAKLSNEFKPPKLRS